MHIQYDVSLKDKHTLHAEATAKQLIVIESPDECRHIPREAFILGGGSNVIFLSTVSQPIVQLPWVKHYLIRETKHDALYYAEAGVLWHDVVMATAGLGLYGLENLALIPGTVGAAPVQNIGAYGCEVCQSIAYIDVYDRLENRILSISVEDCAFSYRQSNFKKAWKQRFLIVGVAFNLQKNAALQLNYPDLATLSDELSSPMDVANAVCGIREKKLPDPNVLPNAGSFFHNPIVDYELAVALKCTYSDMPTYPYSNHQVKLSAAWLIDQCGLKGVSNGKVGIYEHHALILINYSGRGEDILSFAAEIQKCVFDRFAIHLHIEPTVVGDKFERI